MKAEVKLDDASLRDMLQQLKKIGDDALPVLEQVTDEGAKLVEEHAKDQHFFMGTGRHTRAEEDNSEIVFTNPDGSPRFRIRTGNLRNSIAMTEAKREKGVVFSEVVAGERYAKDVENGGPGRRAFPFFRPAAEAKKAEYVEKAAKLFREFLDKWK